MEETKECKTIELRSGKELPDPNKNQKPNTNNKEGSSYMEEENKDGWIEVQKPVPQQEQVRYVPKLPCPQRQLKHKLNQKLQEFLNNFRKLIINILFVEALEQMSNYARFMKQILSKKKRQEEFEIVALIEECIALLQKKLHPKLKDLGRFIIPYSIGSNFSCKTCCDLSISINMMPLSIYKKLGLGEVKLTIVKLQLADKSYIFPKGEI